MGGSPVSPFPIEKWVVEVQTLAVNMCEVVREPFSDQLNSPDFGGCPNTERRSPPVLVLVCFEVRTCIKVLDRRRGMPTQVRIHTCSNMRTVCARREQKAAFWLSAVRPCRAYADTRLQCARRTWTRTSGRFLSTAACRPNRSLRQNPSVPSAGFPIRVVKGVVKGSALGQRNVHDLLKLTQS